MAASGDLAVSGTVEPGASLSSGSHVTVGRGVIGRKTRVTAGGQIRAQFAQEATLAASGDILLGHSAYCAQLRAEGSVVVSRSSSGRGGIVGGETWARDRIRTCTAGTHGGTRTCLITGLDGGSAREMDRLTRAIEVLSEHVHGSLERFGVESIDTVHIRNMIRAATGPRRRVLTHQAQQLGKLAQVYQAALSQRAEVRGRRARAFETSDITVTDTAHAGMSVRIGDAKTTLLNDVHRVRFLVRGGELVQEPAAD